MNDSYVKEDPDGLPLALLLLPDHDVMPYRRHRVHVEGGPRALSPAIEHGSDRITPTQDPHEVLRTVREEGGQGGEEGAVELLWDRVVFEVPAAIRPSGVRRGEEVRAWAGTPP